MSDKNYYITLGLLFVAMSFLCFPAVWNTLPASEDTTPLINAAPSLTLQELYESRDALRQQVPLSTADRISPDEFFEFRDKLVSLLYSAQKLEGTPDKYSARSLSLSLTPVRESAANTYHQSRRGETAAKKAEFEAARDRWAARQPRPVFTTNVTWREVGWRWITALLSCFPFAVATIILRQRKRRRTGWQIAAEFLSDWRPLVASCTGPVGPALYPKSNHDFKGDLKLVTYSLSMLITAAVGGAGAVAAKAQQALSGEKDKKGQLALAIQPCSEESLASSDPPKFGEALQVAVAKKPSKWTRRFYTRFTGANLGLPNQQPQGLLRLTMVHASGWWWEGQSLFNRSAVTNEAYGGKFLLNRKTRWFNKAQVGPLVGVSTSFNRHQNKDTSTVRGLIGTRFNLTRGRLNIFSPATQLEAPLKQRTKWSLVSTVRAGFTFTKRLSVVQETFAKGVYGAKPSGHIGLFGLFKLNDTTTIGFGPIVNQSNQKSLRLDLVHVF